MSSSQVLLTPSFFRGVGNGRAQPPSRWSMEMLQDAFPTAPGHPGLRFHGTPVEVRKHQKSTTWCAVKNGVADTAARCSYCTETLQITQSKCNNYLKLLGKYIYIPGPANGQKKKVVLVNDYVFSQLTYFGSDRAVQPKRPKMAEIWLKSNFLCVSMVSHPITSLSFTIATLVALIDPWRVWLDPWGLRFQA